MHDAPIHGAVPILVYITHGASAAYRNELYPDIIRTTLPGGGEASQAEMTLRTSK